MHPPYFFAKKKTAAAGSRFLGLAATNLVLFRLFSLAAKFREPHEPGALLHNSRGGGGGGNGNGVGGRAVGASSAGSRVSALPAPAPAPASRSGVRLGAALALLPAPWPPPWRRERIHFVQLQYLSSCVTP